MARPLTKATFLILVLALLPSGAAAFFVSQDYGSVLMTGPGAATLRAVNPCAAKTLNPCLAKTLSPCAAKTINPCQAKNLAPVVITALLFLLLLVGDSANEAPL